MQKRIIFFLPLIVFVLLAYFLLRAMSQDSSEVLPSPLIGKSFPEFKLPALNTDDQSIQKVMLLGEPFLLNIWASWCPSCRAEHGFLTDLSNRGVKIVGLNYKDTNADAHAFIAKFGNPYRVIIVDKKGRLGLDLGVYGAPETYLVSAEGIILHKRVGVMDERVWQEQFQNLWEKALAAPISETETGASNG